MVDNLRLIILRKTSECYEEEGTSSIEEFIDFWKKFYYFWTDDVYFKNLKPIIDLSDNNIEELYEWKNGRRVAIEKQIESIERIKQKLNEIKNTFEKSVSDDELEEIYNYSKTNFFQSGYVWNIFFLHILKYETCPIADRYVYKAHNFMINEKNKTLKNDWKSYLSYRKFFNDIAIETKKHTKRDIDRALLAFGEFLEYKDKKSNSK